MTTLSRAFALILSFGAPAALAQVPLLDGTTQSASVARARYESAMRAEVDSVVLGWQRAFAAHDARDISELYWNDAIVSLTGGGALVGREEIRRWYERVFTRLRSPRITIDDVNRTEDVVRVRGTLIGQVTSAAGSYEHVGTIELELRTNSWERLEIVAQRGGDLLSLTALSPSNGVRTALTPDTVRVQLLDAAGRGVRNAEIAFGIGGRHGAIAPAIALTDGNGIATAVFVPSSVHETDIVTARAALLPSELVSYRIRMIAPEALAAASELVRATGAHDHFDSAFARLIAGRHPAASGDAVDADSAVALALGLLAARYAEQLSVETMRSVTAFYASPAGREFVAVRPILDEVVPVAEEEWRAMLDQRLEPNSRPGGASPR